MYMYRSEERPLGTALRSFFPTFFVSVVAFANKKVGEFSSCGAHGGYTCLQHSGTENCMARTNNVRHGV